MTAEFYDSRELRWESEVATGSQIQTRILMTNSVLAKKHFMAGWTYHKQSVVEVTPSGQPYYSVRTYITLARRPSSIHHIIILSYVYLK
jgi:hypothetical protein